jgi:4-azaleucine resistance transporter AzlC
LSGVSAGAVAAIVLMPGVFVFGTAFGILAGQRGLSVAEATLMSALACAGTAQFAALQEWTNPAPVLAAGLASLALNARYVLLGAAARPWFRHASVGQAYLSMFFLYDGNWALAAREQAGGRHDAAHLLGGGLMLWSGWTLATALGHLFGAALGDIHRLGLDFVLTGFFATLLVGFVRGVRDVPVAAVAIIVAVVTDAVFPGPWYLITGAVAGSAVAAFAGGHEEPAS